MVALFNFIKIAIIDKHTDNKRLIASLTKQKAIYLRCLINLMIGLIMNRMIGMKSRFSKR
jgi:hypothetical protein